ncbi:hypothetical protein BaRGS_00019994 [Batillaria attramentaria]|uniref:Uncharacterized protein n=1 Tax=Batillaria attramentaria TaxID=370345 RepID=A0ABD0KP56_9CAEN
MGLLIYPSVTPPRHITRTGELKTRDGQDERARKRVGERKREMETRQGRATGSGGRLIEHSDERKRWWCFPMKT